MKHTIESINEAYDKAPIKIKSEATIRSADYSNFNTEFSFLIEKTGRFVESYQADLLTSINSFMKKYQEMLETLQEGDGTQLTEVFGLRENGVDHDVYVISKMNEMTSTDLDLYYRKIYALRVTAYRTGGSVDMTVELRDLSTEIPMVVYRHS